MNEMLMIQRDLNGARTLTDANNGIHALVVQANKVFDLAVQYIVQINYSNAPRDLKQRNSYAAQKLIEILQQTMGLDNQSMQMAVKRRVDLEVEYIQQGQEAEARRMAIGFTRNETSESFHREDGMHRQRAGFIVRREIEAERTAEKLETIGFTNPKPETVDRSIQQLIEYYQDMGIIPKESQTIGFTPVKESKETNASETQPIGFMRFKAESDIIDPNLLHQIVFDMQYGSFNFQRAQP
ncbi:MAG: hypothetical protein MJK18_15255 [Bdellovibrionales bacterium]|nr:hypothetical protein [Bdellovibrionales bacterium]